MCANCMHGADATVASSGPTRAGADLLVSVIEMSFLEFLITRAAPRTPLNYPPLPTGPGRFLDTRY